MAFHEKAYGIAQLAIALVLTSSHLSLAYMVSDLVAECRNGQVFLTWTNPSEANLQFNVYRSSTKIATSGSLASATYLGFVRDNSAKNIRLSQLLNEDIYYQVKDGGPSLSTSDGLYVVTCTDNGSWYYAVTVTDLTNGKESVKITIGKNSLPAPVQELTEKPQPVFQFSEAWLGTDVVDRYVQFVNNQETDLYPAMNSTGSYGFNFYLLKRGDATKFPLFVLYEGLIKSSLAGNGFDEFENGGISNCYILGVDDWVPIKKGNGDIGDNTYWFGYHEEFNIYSKDNPVPTSGVVKLYSQQRYIQAMRWVKESFPIDVNQVYTVGISAGGYGAQLTAAIVPEEITAVYAVVEPLSVGSNGLEVYTQMWGSSSNLPTDVLDWQTGEPLLFNKISDLRNMIEINKNRDLPLLFDIHGRNDNTVGWSSGKIDWLEALEANNVGGIFRWDGRGHDGSKADYTDKEITPDFYRYTINKSYPAFSNCSINQDPGNGNKSNGDDYGAINGYLDWEDNIKDKECDYSINVFVKDLYVGGLADPEQYSSCTTDITFRRFKKFNPATGSTIKWKNYDVTDTKIQNGSFTYAGGLITIKNIKVNKTGNRIELSIANCNKSGAEDFLFEEEIYFTRTSDGYIAHITMDHSEVGSVTVVDLMGRIISRKSIELSEGTNDLSISLPASGIYLVSIGGPSFSHTEKLLFQ